MLITNSHSVSLVVYGRDAAKFILFFVIVVVRSPSVPWGIPFDGIFERPCRT